MADTWPPAVATVSWLKRRLPPAWGHGLGCPYCVAPWACAAVGLPVVVWGLSPVWWTVCGWLAAAYVAAWIVRADLGR